jgi:hypothetical protein
MKKLILVFAILFSFISCTKDIVNEEFQAQQRASSLSLLGVPNSTLGGFVFTPKSIDAYYNEIGNSHNYCLNRIYTGIEGQSGPGTINLNRSFIITTALNYVKANENAGLYATDQTYINRMNADIIDPYLNGTRSVANVPISVTNLCSELKSLIYNSTSTDPYQLGLMVDNFFNSRKGYISDSSQQIAFAAYAGTFKSSLSFWNSAASGPMVQASFKNSKKISAYRKPTPGKVNGKKLAFADAIGALKGAWEFGRIGLLLGGGAGAFVVGATGAIFEGAGASAAAYREDKGEQVLGIN